MESVSFLPVAYDPTYKLILPQNHRFPMEKYELLPQQLLLEGTCESYDFFVPEAAPLETILKVHDASYVQRLNDLSLSKSESRSIGFPISEELIKREFLIAGGTIMGCQKAFKTGIALNIAGGTHHAFRDRGEAFCLLNDQAIAAQYLLDHQQAQQILILDLDVHQGNGTAEIFKNEPAVFTCSFHGAKNYPFRKEKSDLDIAFPDQTEDEHYLSKMQEVIPKLLDQIQPDFIFYLCGVDVLSTDKLGRLGMTLEGCCQRDLFVLNACKSRNIPVQCSMGGGYSKEIKTIIEAHANTFRTAKSVFC
ncbi:MAG: histone deacetylase [Flavobacteriaceae bacterium]